VLLSPASLVVRPFDLLTAVRDRSWAWLFQVGARLNLDVHIVDLRAVPVLSEPSDAVNTTLRDPEFAAMVGRAQRDESTETVRIGSNLVACAALRVGGVDRGVLTLLRPVSKEKAVPPAERRLDQIGAWLRRAVEAHLESDVTRPNDEAQRLTALRRALADCGAESELDLVRVLGEAVSIWEDVEVRAYAQGLDDDFVQQWAPPGTTDEEIPATLSIPASIQTRELAPLSGQSLQQLGIASSADVLAAQLAPNGSRWWLMFVGPVDPACEIRLSLYVDVLEQSLKQLAVAANLQLCRSVWRHLLAFEEDLERSADAVLREIVGAVEGDFAALLVTFPHGGRALAAGQIERFADRPAPGRQSSRLTTTRLLGAGGTLMVAVGRAEGAAPFTRHEREIVETVSELVESWAAVIIRRAPLGGERRSAARSYRGAPTRCAHQAGQVRARLLSGIEHACAGARRLDLGVISAAKSSPTNGISKLPFG